MTNVKDCCAKGDGITDDTAAIQAAIVSASADGLVYFPPGVYLVSKQAGGAYCFAPPSDRTFVGAGQGLTTIKAAPDQTDSVRIFTLDNVTRVRFANLTLDGNRSAQTPSEHRHGIFIMRSSDVMIERVTATAFLGDGISLYKDVSSVVIQNCAIWNCGRDGIAFTGGGCKDIRIINCTIHDVEAQPIDSEPDSLPAGSVDDVTIRDCNLTALTSQYAVTTGGYNAETPNRRWRIEGSRITGAIDVIRCDDLKIRDNTITNTDNIHAAVSGRYRTTNILVTGNTVISNAQPCLRITAVAGEAADRWNVAGNTFQASGNISAVHVSGCSNAQVIDNTITGGGQGYGVNVYSTVQTDSLMVNSNSVSGFAVGFYCASYQDRQINRLMLTGNIINVSGTGIQLAGSAALYRTVMVNANIISAVTPVTGAPGMTLAL